MAAPVLGTLYVSPFFVSEDCVITQLSVVISAAGAAGTAKARIGVWADGAGVPGALIFDAGQVATDVTQERSIATWIVVSRGWYWRGAVTQGSGATGTYRSIAGANGLVNAYPLQHWSAGIPVIGSSAGAAPAVSGYTITGETGAFANNFWRTPPASQTIADNNVCILVGVKVSVPILDG